MSIDSFIERWRGLVGGAERADYQMFLAELCDALDLPRPNPAGAAATGPAYRFEHPVRGDKGQPLRIDLYKQHAFILEAKQSRLAGGSKEIPGQAQLFTLEKEQARERKSAWDSLMRNAFTQAWDYANRLDADHDRPPFILVCDVGRGIDVYADFTGQGRNYRPFPDPKRRHIAMEDLANPEVQARLRAIWTNPMALDPALQRARATREIAEHLAEVSKSLEQEGAPPEEAATFLMRCLFAMFAEDVGLLPKESFTRLLADSLESPGSFMMLAQDLFRAMDEGGDSVALRTKVKRFNGAFYKDRRAFPLKREAIGALIEAAKADWREVEPAIFGSLLEQALSAADRARLGAHYTPRPYVERLVTATVIEPLRADCEVAQSVVDRAREEGDMQGAVDAVAAFHGVLTRTRILDPACGTGNFLYVTLELMKALEAEVLAALHALEAESGATSSLVRRDVDPSQFFGLELNPRAAAIAELVLWIYLQTIYRQGDDAARDPVLQDYGTINPVGSRRKPSDVCIDAVLLHDGPIIGGGGTHYPRPRLPVWPEAEFIVGNPPFIGGSLIRSEQGDAYVEALWKAHPAMNDSADFVMYWWDRCADILTRKGSKLRRFGLVTTNSITQVLQRRTLARWMTAKRRLSLVFAIDNHPWTRAAKDAAAVRIAMTTAEAGKHEGKLLSVEREAALDSDQPEIEVREQLGTINPDLTMGVDVTRVAALRANDLICSPGVKLHGAGFIVRPSQAEHLGLGRRAGLEHYIRHYRNGRDLTGHSRDSMVIDLHGLTVAEVRDRYPEVYQHVLAKVKPERDRNNEDYRRTNWWLFGRRNTLMRGFTAGLNRYIATGETAKHRVFQFLDGEILPDNMLVAIGVDASEILAVLSSDVHVRWTLSQGGTLEDRPRYTKSVCFDPFPFPAWTEVQRKALAEAGERLDAFRKARLAEHPDLTLTRLYNALEAHRACTASGIPMNPQEAADFDAGSVLILDELHRTIDRLTLEAYGWPQGETTEQRLARLVALNAERVAEEAQGQVRWLRPEYQTPRFARQEVAGPQKLRDLIGDAPAKVAGKAPFPLDRTGQHLAVLSRLHAANGPLSTADVAAGFKGAKVIPRVDGALRALARLGYAQPTPDGHAYTARRAA